MFTINCILKNIVLYIVNGVMYIRIYLDKNEELSNKNIL